MFERIFNALFVKTEKKSGVTVISAKREIKIADNNASAAKIVKPTRDDFFWENRGKTYAALFNSLNGRVF